MNIQRIYNLAIGAIAVGSLLLSVLFVSSRSGEHDRTCQAFERGIHLTIEALTNLPQRSSLPKRTPAEEAQRKVGLTEAYKRIDASLAKC